MDEVVLPITPRNIVTVTIMAAVGFALYAWVGQAYQQWRG